MTKRSEWKVALEVSTVFETYGGGVGYSTAHLASALRTILGEDRIRFFSPRGAKQDLPLGGPFAGERLHPFWKLSRPYRYFYREYVLPREIEKFAPSVVHFPDAKVPRSVRQDGRAVVVTVHDMGAYAGQVPREHAPRHKRTIEEGVASADLVIAISDFTRNSLIEILRVNPRKVRTVYYGISELYEPLSPEAWAPIVRARFGLGAGYFLFVGEVNERKNLLPLLEAHRRLPPLLRRSHPLVIAGRIDRSAGSSRGAFVRDFLSRIDEHVTLTGMISEKEKLFLYNGALAFVFPSKYEGFGLPVLEAMASGTAVIALGNPVVRELHEGKVLALERDDPDELAAAMKEIAGNEGRRRRLVEEGKEHAAAFSWRRTALQTIEAYEEAMREKGA
jgi:alpha-1,3-rhamnosyl/mannosyltransferase